MSCDWNSKLLSWCVWNCWFSPSMSTDGKLAPAIFAPGAFAVANWGLDRKAGSRLDNDWLRFMNGARLARSGLLLAAAVALFRLFIRLLFMSHWVANGSDRFDRSPATWNGCIWGFCWAARLGLLLLLEVSLLFDKKAVLLGGGVAEDMLLLSLLLLWLSALRLLYKSVMTLNVKNKNNFYVE